MRMNNKQKPFSVGINLPVCYAPCDQKVKGQSGIPWTLYLFFDLWIGISNIPFSVDLSIQFFKFSILLRLLPMQSGCTPGEGSIQILEMLRVVQQTPEYADY